MKKGFTLVEMLAVIALVAVLALVIVPGVESVIKKSREDAYQTQLQNLIQGAKNWGAENIKSLPKTEGEYIIVTLNDLKTSGFIKNDMKDPRVKKCISNETSIKISKINNNYNYEIYGAVETYEDLVCDETSVTTYRSLYNEVLKSTEINNIDKLLEEEFGQIPDDPALQMELAIFPRGLIYYGENPKNWVKINDYLFRMVRIDDNYIKAIYEKTCNGNTCTEDGTISAKKYSGFGTDSNNLILEWNNSNNQVDKDLNEWYKTLNIDNYTVPINWETSYDININQENNGVTTIIKSSDLFTKDKISYGLLDVYEGALTTGSFSEDVPLSNAYLYKNNTDRYLTMKSYKTNMMTGTNELADVMYILGFNKTATEVQFLPDMCTIGYCTEAIIRPSITIRQNIKVKNGTGTEADPFVLMP